MEPRLVLIKEFKAVGEYVDGHVIYKIKSVAFLSLGNHDSLNLTTCKKHQHFTFTKKVLSICKKIIFINLYEFDM